MSDNTSLLRRLDSKSYSTVASDGDTFTVSESLIVSPYYGVCTKDRAPDIGPDSRWPTRIAVGQATWPN